MTLARRSFGLPLAMVRHAIVALLAAGAILVPGQMLALDLAAQPLTWMAVAIGLGVLAAIVGRGLVGATFVVAGFFVGLWLLLAIRSGSTASASAAFGEDGWLYVGMLAAAVAAYLAVVLVMDRLRARRSAA